MEDTLKDFRFEVMLIVGGIITLVGFFLPWAEWGNSVLYGYSETAGILSFIGAWLMVIGSMISYDLFRSQLLNSFKPYSDAGLGIIGGGLAVISTIAFEMSTMGSISENYSLVSGYYVTFIGAIVALFASIMMVWQQVTEKSPRRERGKSGGL